MLSAGKRGAVLPHMNSLRYLPNYMRRGPFEKSHFDPVESEVSINRAEVLVGSRPTCANPPASFFFVRTEEGLLIQIHF